MDGDPCSATALRARREIRAEMTRDGTAFSPFACWNIYIALTAAAVSLMLQEAL